MSARLTFLGAAGSVTGSRFLLSSGRRSYLIDCGLIQGGREMEALNWLPFAAPLDALDGILLTHALSGHADQEELIRWLGGFARPQQTFLVHGEPSAAQELGRQIRRRLGWSAIIPGKGDRAKLA
jgi:Cft2 family RNA processing exonuclease